MIAIFVIVILDAIFIFVLLCMFIKYMIYVSKEIKKYNNDFQLLRSNYIAYNDIKPLLDKYEYLREKTTVGLTKKIRFFKDTYDNLYKNVSMYNEEYIQKELENNKEYFDNIFDYPLDIEQRKAIITDDNNNLIIAGAGSGKTTTIIGKTKYLLEKKGIDPREIITISFTNAAKDNFILKLNDNRVSCSTFHKLGKDIIDDGNFKSDIAPEDYLEKVIKEYLSKDIIDDPEKSKHLIKLHAYYMHIQNSEDKDFGDVIELEKGFDLTTLKYKYESRKTKDLETLKEEKVKSLQELIIANFLFLNGINYEYEARYEYDTRNYTYRQYHPDFYLPDYEIYIEHFGINREGRAPQYNEIEEKRYLDGIEAKREIHKEFRTKLIETYSYDFDNFNIENVLEEKLKKNGVIFKPVDYKEIIDTISQIHSEETTSLYNLISKFIKMFKGNMYELNAFDEFYNDSCEKGNTRNMYLLEVIKDIYVLYQEKLKEEEYIDFDDMINLATERVENSYDKKISYIIIDEFQDISFSRYRLVKAIQNKTNAKVVAVGDDWQSIYRFSGCDLNLFVNFEKYFPHPQIMYINNTYRNSQKLIDMAGNFIMQNEKGQIKKSLISNIKNENTPVEYYYYVRNIVGVTIDAIKSLADSGCKKIAILGRNNSDIMRYEDVADTDKNEIYLSGDLDIELVFNTVHRSKGLEYDGVIICNMDNYIAGFPNKMADDPLLDYVTLTKDDYLYEEERRLFYVALTRTKTKCCLLVPIVNPSMFANELNDLSGDGIKKVIYEDDPRLHNPSCPRCKTGILLLRNNNSDNSSFVGCSNYPRCDYSINNTYILNSDMICPKCGSPMIKRKGKNGVFYGCSQYPYCQQTIESNEDYSDVGYNYFDDVDEEIEEDVSLNSKGINCPKCGASLEKKKGKYGEFLSCSNYPDCTYSKDIDDKNKKNESASENKLEIKCPKCGARMVKRKGKRGEFYRYPECRKTIDIREISKYIKR